VWLGGAVTLGAVSAPAVFRTAKQAGHTRLGMPLYDFASTAVTDGFGRFNAVILAAGAVMLVSGLLYGRLTGACRVRLGVRAALTALAWGVAAWLTFALFPQMLQARDGGDMDVFRSMHKTYSSGFSAQLLLLLAVAALTGWLDLDRAPRPMAAPAVAETRQPVPAVPAS